MRSAVFRAVVSRRYQGNAFLHPFPLRTTIEDRGHNCLGVAIATIIAGRSLHRTVRARLRIRLPPCMSGTLSLLAGRRDTHSVLFGRLQQCLSVRTLQALPERPKLDHHALFLRNPFHVSILRNGVPKLSCMMRCGSTPRPIRMARLASIKRGGLQRSFRFDRLPRRPWITAWSPSCFNFTSNRRICRSVCPISSAAWRCVISPYLAFFRAISRSRSRWVMVRAPCSDPPSLTSSIGHFYLALIGHSHVAAT